MMRRKKRPVPWGRRILGAGGLLLGGGLLAGAADHYFNKGRGLESLKYMLGPHTGKPLGSPVNTNDLVADRRANPTPEAPDVTNAALQYNQQQAVRQALPHAGQTVIQDAAGLLGPVETAANVAELGSVGLLGANSLLRKRLTGAPVAPTAAPPTLPPQSQLRLVGAKPPVMPPPLPAATPPLPTQAAQASQVLAPARQRLRLLRPMPRVKPPVMPPALPGTRPPNAPTPQPPPLPAKTPPPPRIPLRIPGRPPYVPPTAQPPKGQGIRKLVDAIVKSRAGGVAGTALKGTARVAPPLIGMTDGARLGANPLVSEALQVPAEATGRALAFATHPALRPFANALLNPDSMEGKALGLTPEAAASHVTTGAGGLLGTVAGLHPAGALAMMVPHRLAGTASENLVRQVASDQAVGDTGDILLRHLRGAEAGDRRHFNALRSLIADIDNNGILDQIQNGRQEQGGISKAILGDTSSEYPALQQLLQRAGKLTAIPK